MRRGARSVMPRTQSSLRRLRRLVCVSAIHETVDGRNRSGRDGDNLKQFGLLIKQRGFIVRLC
jgi:hypothetical protein